MKPPHVQPRRSGFGRFPVSIALAGIAGLLLLGSGAALAQSPVVRADLNGDGVVNFGDLALMKSVFFQSYPRFEDRGATIFDHQTNLEWEKKTGVVGGASDGSLHDVNNIYSWSTGTNNPDGDAFTVFLAGFNGGAPLGMSADGKTSSGPCYVGHCDWRLPTIAELNTIIDCSYGHPCVNPIFGPTCIGPTCPTYFYMSTSSVDPENIWFTTFSNPFGPFKGSNQASFYVRAVRGGP